MFKRIVKSLLIGWILKRVLERSTRRRGRRAA